MVDSAALDELTESITGSDGVLASTARHLLGKLGLADTGVAEDSEDLDAELVRARRVRARLGLGPQGGAVLRRAPRGAARRPLGLASARTSPASGSATTRRASAASPVSTRPRQAQAGWWLDRARREKRTDLVSFYDGAISAADAQQEWRRRGRRGHRCRPRLDRRRRRGRPAPWRCHRRRDHVAAGQGAPGVLPRPLPRPRVDRCRPVGAAGQPGVVRRRRRARRVDLLPRGGVGRRPEDRAAPGAVADAGLPLRRTVGPGHGGRRRSRAPRSSSASCSGVWSAWSPAWPPRAPTTRSASACTSYSPGSPNRGRFGGDGAYGEAKAAFDAFVQRWQAEKDWAARVSLAHAHIGWVRGTGLMGHNDPLVDAVTEAGVRTWSPQEMAAELLELCSTESRESAADAPLVADLTGGLGEADLDLAALAREAREAAEARRHDETRTRTSAAGADPPRRVRLVAADHGLAEDQHLARGHGRHRRCRRGRPAGLLAHPLRARGRGPPVPGRRARAGVDHRSDRLGARSRSPAGTTSSPASR